MLSLKYFFILHQKQRQNFWDIEDTTEWIKTSETLIDNDDPIKGFQEQIEKLGISVTDFYSHATTTEDNILAEKKLLTTETLFMGDD